MGDEIHETPNDKPRHTVDYQREFEEIERDLQRDRRRKQVTSTLAAVLSLVAGIAAALVTNVNTGIFTTRGNEAARKAALQQEQITDQLKALSTQSQELRQSIAAISRTAQSQGGIPSLQIGALQDGLHKLDVRLSSLEDAITSDPGKALAVPMMRKDMESLQQRYRDDIVSVRDEIGRVYTLTQWFIALMFTIALGVFTLAIGNLRRSSKNEKQ